MNWTELLTSEMSDAYRATEKLMDLVDEGSLSWKPASGENWMTTGQLLMHLTNACGMTCRGFVTGEWPQPASGSEGEGGMLPAAEKMPSVKSVAEAKERLAADKKAALGIVKEAGEKDLAEKPCPAPWDPRGMPLGQRLLTMVEHLASHKSQLYYYLKLQGKPVNTMHLWGM